MVQQELLNMLQCYFKNQTISSSPSKELLHLVKEQSLMQYLYPIYKQDIFQKPYLLAVLLQEKFRRIQEELTSLFNQHEIKHFYIKGSVLHTLYPDIALRTRGDIDIFVKDEQFNDANIVLKNNGFELEPNDNMHHFEYKKNGLTIELHFALFDDNGDNVYYNYFKKPFLFCQQYQNSLYYLTHEYHYAYCLCHFARHLKSGAGIRYILDFYYMLKNWNLNLEELNKIIFDLKLTRLQQCILNVIYLLTSEKVGPVTDENMEFFINYLLACGIHGNGNNENIEEKHLKNYDHRFKYMFARLFMVNRMYRLSLYPRLGKHWYTYPFCLIHHAFFLFTHKFKKFIKLLFRRKSQEDKERDSIHKKLGIK